MAVALKRKISQFGRESKLWRSRRSRYWFEKRQTNNENEDIEIVEKSEEKGDDNDWPCWKPLTNKDTSGRISKLFYGPLFWKIGTF